MSGSEHEADDGISPEEAFSLLSDGTRVEILREVWVSPEPLSFSELRESVGTEDSGLFNYHLDKLTGHFIRRGEDGYVFRQAGKEVVRAVLAGAINRAPELEPSGIDEACVDCGSELEAFYDEGMVVRCSDCDTLVMRNEFPPAGLKDRSPQEAAEAFEKWTRSRFLLSFEGVCPSCAGKTGLADVESGSGGRVFTEQVCENCAYASRTPAFVHVLDHPDVVSLYQNHGTEIRDKSYWEMLSYAEDYDASIVSDDPWKIRVVVRVGQESLTLLLDEDMNPSVDTDAEGE